MFRTTYRLAMDIFGIGFTADKLPKFQFRRFTDKGRGRDPLCAESAF